jgi:hypothetical protein
VTVDGPCVCRCTRSVLSLIAERPFETQMGTWETSRGELRVASDREFEQRALPLLHVFHPGMIHPSPVQHLDRSVSTWSFGHWRHGSIGCRPRGPLRRVADCTTVTNSVGDAHGSPQTHHEPTFKSDHRRGPISKSPPSRLEVPIPTTVYARERSIQLASCSVKREGTSATAYFIN